MNTQELLYKIEADLNYLGEIEYLEYGIELINIPLFGEVALALSEIETLLPIEYSCIVAKSKSRYDNKLSILIYKKA